MGSLKDYQIQTERGVYDKRNKINNLTGKEWLFSTRSVKTKDYSYWYDYREILAQGYIDFMPIELASEIITTFSKSNSIIIDPICNFGSIGFATGILSNDREYFGFKFKKIKKLNLQKEVNIKNINFSHLMIRKNLNLHNKNNSNLLFSELIYTSLNVNEREYQFLDFEENLRNAIDYMINLNLTFNYIIIAIQNTKGYNLYNNNTKKISSLIKTFDYNLKSELIWKIPDSIFLLAKDHLKSTGISDAESSYLLNDKRILVFRMN